MERNTFDQISMERLIRDIEEEKAMRLLQQVMKNNIKFTKTVDNIRKRNAEKNRKE